MSICGVLRRTGSLDNTDLVGLGVVREATTIAETLDHL